MPASESEPVRKNQDLNNNFLEPILSIENMDRFLVRSSILKAIKEVRPKLDGMVLDLGCGDKPYRTLIVDDVNAECQYLGMDIPNILYQKNTYPDLFWDGFAIPLANQSVNHIIATEVFEHVPDLSQVLNEAHRVLKPGGLIFFTTPFLWPIHDAPHDEYRYTPFSLERIFKKSGFGNINIKAMGGWNASLAQMIGLWLRRSPISGEVREKFSTQLFSLYQDMVASDEIPDKLTSEMYTGLYGTGQKLHSTRNHGDANHAILLKNIGSENKKGKKLIHIVGLFPALSETFILDQITGLIDRGYEIEIWSIYGAQDDVVQPSVSEYKLMNFTHNIILPSRELWEDEGQWVDQFKQLNPYFDIQQVLAFHVHFGIVFNQLIPLFKHYSHTSTIVSFYGADATRYIKENGDHCYDYLFLRANLITSPSEYLRRIVIAQGCPEDKVVVHRCGINTRNYVLKKDRSHSSKIRILTVARLVEKKGIEYSLRAIAQLSDRHRVQYHIVGDGPLRESLLNLIAQLGLSEQVTLLGSQDRSQLILEMQNTDIFLLTSITAADGDQEGLPVALVEAQAMGLPVVSTYHSGIPELIVHQQTGLLSQEKDIEGITSHLAQLIENDDLALNYSTNARKRILEEFDIEKLNDRVARYYFMEDSELYTNDYSVENLKQVETNRFGFDLLTTPRFVYHYTNQPYEEMTALLMRQNAKGVKTFIDIGAHYGFFDILIGLSNPDCKIFAFEPVLENSKILKKNLELNHVRADVVPLAVSDQTGKSSFQISKASDNSGFIANPNIGIIRNIETDTTELDQYLLQIPDGPVLVKIDTEGSETKVLAGMHKLIKRVEDLRLVIEVNPTCLEANGSSPSSLLDQLDQLGFDVFVIFDREMKYAKYHPGSDWNEYMGEGTYRNVFCVKKNRSLNICAFSHSGSLGGAETGLLELADSLVAKYGAIFTIILPSEGALKNKIEERGGSTMIIPYHWWCASVLPSASQANDLMRTSYENIEASLASIDRISPDIILTNTMVIPWGALAALMLDRPHIWWVKEFGKIDHNLEFYYTFQKTLEIIKESSNHIVVNSNSVKNILFPELGPEDCTVAINNVSLAARTPYKETYFRYSTSTKIVIAGNIARAKGQDQAVHAVKKLIQSKHDVELCIVGGVYSSFGENLKSLVKMEGLEDRVHFVGFIENIRSLLEQADINLMCSENEAFGRVTAEAMLLGLPVIGTNTGGTVELIDDGETGFLYSPGDVNELANKIIFFIDHPEKIKEFGERAQKSMTKKLAVNPADMVLSQYFQNYKDDQNKKSLQLFQMTVMWQADIARKHRDLAQEKDKTIQLLTVQNEAFTSQAAAFTTQIAEKEQTVLALTAQVVKLDQAAQAVNLQMEGFQTTVQAQLAQKDAQLHEILDSRVWKIVLFFRRIRILSYSLKKYLTRFIQRSINFFFRPIKRIKRNITHRRNLALIRSSDLFDETFYLVNNPDVAQTMQDPLSHYLYIGGFKGRDPGPVFDSDWYLDTYEDVKKSGINPLIHYLRSGKKEGRAAHLDHVNPNSIALHVGDIDDFDTLKQKPENLIHYEFLKGSQTNESSRDTVLIVCHEASLTGAPILGLNLAQNLQKKYNVVSLLLADGPIRENFYDVSVFEIVGSLPFRYDIALIDNMIEQMTKLFEFKFAIVNSIESRAVLPALANRFVPIINLIHEFASYTKPRQVFPEAILWSQETIFSASVTHENALLEYPELVDHPFHIIPQGRCVIPAVNGDSASQQIEAARVLKELRPEGLPVDTVVVLGIGTIQLRKGVDLFIECASRVVQSGHGEHCRFVWIGKGYDPEWDVNYSVYIADQIRRSGLQQHVFFMEETSNIEVVYKAADILLISSRLDPLPNVAFDAMTHGLPIICFAKTTGIADILIANHLGEECVAPYLDTVEMAARVNVFIESKAMRQKVGEQLRQLVFKEFNMEHYVRQLEDLAQVASDDVIREQKDIAEISKSLQIRLDFFLPPHLKSLSRDEAIRYYVRSWKAGIHRRKVIPGFHPGIFLEQGGPGESTSNSLANYLRAGQPHGPWRTDVITAEDIVQPISSGMRIALHLHIYYPDLLEEILNLLMVNIVRPDLFVSVPTESVRDEVDIILKNYSGKIMKIQVVPNRGRDIGPFLTAFGRTFVEHYDLVGHFHTKKTADLQDQEMGNNWRKFLLENLLGGKSNMADIILGRMSTDSSIGMVFPDDPHIVGWGGNKTYAEDLGQRLGLNNALPEHFLFPIGTMFWARVEALRPIFDLGLDWQDYPSEPLPYDGSILHGLERIFPFVVAKQGFRSILTNVEGMTR